MSRCAAAGRPRRVTRWSVALVLWLAGAALPAFALTGSASGRAAGLAGKGLLYHGYRLTVPAGWPVYDLARSPTTCVRFNRHAVYLGTPGAHQLCPGHAAGRTEAILVEPAPAAAARDGRGTAPLPVPALARASGPGGELVRRAGAATVIATWSTRPGLIRRALHISRLSPTTARPARPATPDARLHAQIARAGRRATAADAAQVYTGLGFDACSAPSASQMSAWSVSPFRAVGIYIGGANMACSQANLTATWVSQQAAAGWHMVPIYVGLQAPGNSCGCAAFTAANATSQGTAAALDAVTQAQSLGLGTGNPIYLDMEAYRRGGSTTTAVLSFIGAWTAQLHSSGYRSGVYSSENSGVADLVSQWGTTYTEPDELWIANWNNQQSTADPIVPATEWANHQRLHQYRGDHTDNYGGAKLDIDSDYVDALTAGPGAGVPPPPPTPSLRVAPAADGSIALSPSWRGGPQVNQWQLLGGASPDALTPATAPVSAGGGGPIVVHSAYAYFAVSALDVSGQNLGTSAPVPTPSHLALVGGGIYVPANGVGAVPVGCFNTAPCHVVTALYAGRSRLVNTGSEHVSVGGGLVYFHLGRSARRRLAAAHRGRLPVTVHIRDLSGMRASRSMTLTAFSTAGRAPARSAAQSPSVQIVGLTDFVSNAWVGGILAGCASNAPCHVSLTLSVGSTVIARTGQEYLGANELGYLIFTLTRAGHAMLAGASGNQLLTRVNADNGADHASARVILVAYH